MRNYERGGLISQERKGFEVLEREVKIGLNNGKVENEQNEEGI